VSIPTNNGAQGANEQAKDQEQDQEQQPDLNNSGWKSHPLTQKIIAELSELKRVEQERQEKAKIEAREAELKKAEEEGRLKEALEKLRSEIESEKKKHAHELMKRDLMAEILKTGVNNDVFIRGALAGYSDESGTIQEYVAALMSDEANKVFLPQQDGSRPVPPRKIPSSTGPVSWEKIKAETKSPDPEVRAKARAAIEAHYRETKQWP
jgi:hypothetical protein